jgi:hypothetical protein
MAFSLMRTVNVTVAAGDSLADATPDLKNLGHVVGFITDANWDTQAVSFKGSVNGTDYFDIYDGATEYSIAGVTASTARTLDWEVLRPYSYIQLRSGTTAAAAAQVDATVVTLICWQLE